MCLGLSYLSDNDFGRFFVFQENFVFFAGCDLALVVVSNDVTLEVSCVCVGCVTIEVTTILEGSLFFKKTLFFLWVAC